MQEGAPQSRGSSKDVGSAALATLLGLVLAALDLLSGWPESYFALGRRLPWALGGVVIYCTLAIAGTAIVGRLLGGSRAQFWALGVVAGTGASCLLLRDLAAVHAVWVGVAVGVAIGGFASRLSPKAWSLIDALLLGTLILVGGALAMRWSAGLLPAAVPAAIAALAVPITAVHRARHRAPRAPTKASAAMAGGLLLLALVPIWQPRGVALERDAGGSGTPAATRPRYPDLFLVTVDTLRHREAVDPHIAPEMAQLASESARVTDAYATAPWTLPSVVSLHTSLQPWQTHGGTRVPESAGTLAELLASHGYATSAIVANQVIGETSGLFRGFEEVVNFSYSELATDLLPALPNLNHWLVEASIRAVGPARLIPDTTAKVMARLERVLDRPTERPLFLWVHFGDPHDPYVLRPPFPEVRPQRIFLAPKDPRLGTPQRTSIREGTTRLTPLDRAEIKQLYDSEVGHVSRAVGRLMKLVAGRRQALLIFSSDHGEEFWEHGGYYHGHSLYDELARVPLWIRGPGIEAGALPGPGSLVDVLPTVAALIGLPPDTGWSGRPLLGAAADPEPRPVFVSANSYGDALRAVVLGGHKLIVDSTGNPTELYDLTLDPVEKNNRVAAAPARVAELLAYLPPAPGDGIAEPATGTDQERLERLRTLGYIN